MSITSNNYNSSKRCNTDKARLGFCISRLSRVLREKENTLKEGSSTIEEYKS
jgi:hypothetical protein